MLELPPQLQEKLTTSLAIIKRKTPERKTLIIGVSLCVFIILLLFLVGDDTSSDGRRFTGTKQTIYSPVDGVVVELPFAEGASVKKGEALLRFDPEHIRRENGTIRDYLAFFQQNRHNTGTLKQKFKPVFADIFDGLAVQRKSFVEKENQAVTLYRDASILHSKLKLDMRNPKNKDENDLPKKELVEKEQQASLTIVKLAENLERASLDRAAIDRQIREITADLSQPYGMLYLYLEEQHANVQSLLRNEYLYADSSAEMGDVFIKKGDLVKKGDPLYEVFLTEQVF